ncbi:DUF202 domain-containing protein [Sodalis ligni]|uniref:Uncharacterized protein DUF202 n=1 Tax=Sodalis ligni TaxID=2697027 RepID=A0A4R1NER9_9GAMM|nr:DUF202 domain-containing protein [Sodalis ligni]TCL03146.1 uncharacterized protein DUF202 [Sodalis ligni]
MDKPLSQKFLRDPGLQPERTYLSWERTLFVIALDSAFFVRSGLVKNSPLILGAGLILIVFTVAMAIVRRRTGKYNNIGLKVKSNQILNILSIAVIMAAGLLIADLLCSLGILLRVK